MLDYARIALAVPEVSVGAVSKNTQRTLEKIKEVEKEADFIVFPELNLCGYTCQDLFLQKTLTDNIKEALNTIAEASEKYDSVIIVGAPVIITGQLYNCAIVYNAGRICGIVPKTFIPNYNEFYEKRWFSSALDLRTDEIMSDNIGVFPSYRIPVSNRLVFEGKEQVRFGVEICEDLWTPIPPSSYLALSGAEIVFNISASNETIGKREYRNSMVNQQSASCLCTYAYVSAGSGESTTDLIFSGHSIVAENGSIIYQNQNFIDGDYVNLVDTDLGKIRADRMKYKSFKDSSALTSTQNCKILKLYGVSGELHSDGSMYALKKLPFVPVDKEKRAARCLSIFEMQVSGLVKRMSVAAMNVVVGVSGGLDSTLALLVCVRAMQKLGRKPENVIGVTMPCFGTTSRTYNNSLALMQSLGVTVKNINIKEACMRHFEDIGHNPDIKDITYENVQARERTQVLMDVANKNDAIVCGTGDLSELVLGWCTYNADHMSMYGVNSSIPKTLIRWMIESLAENDVFGLSSEILKDVADTPISPELLPPDKDGKIAQKTEDSVGPYALHDFFIYYVLRYGYTPEKIFVLAKRAFDGEFDSETIKKWLKVFYRRFFTQQFKRSCLPDGVKVGSACISPRGDLRMPSDASFADWMERADKL